MKYYLFSLIFLVAVSNNIGQNITSLYNVESLPQTLMSNPGAKITFDKHLGIPFLGGVKVSGVSSGITFFDIFSDDEIDVNQKLRAALANLDSKDYLEITEQIDIINAGFRLNERDYLSFGLYQSSDFFMFMPRDIFQLAQDGSAAFDGELYELSQFLFTANIQSVFHAGINRKVNKKFSIGARLKLYSSVLNAKSTSNKGNFLSYRNPETGAVFNTFTDVDIAMQTSGYSRFEETWEAIKNSSVFNNGVVDSTAQTMSGGELTGLLLKRTLLSGNYGVGIDVGFSYDYSDRLQFTGSIQDLGIILHNTDVNNYNYSGDYENIGFEPDFEQGEGIRPLPYWDNFIFNLEDNFEEEETQENYTSWMPFKINASAGYRFTEEYFPCDYRTETKRGYRNMVGLQLHATNRPEALLYKLAAFWDTRFLSNLRFKMTYSLNNYSYNNLGLMLAANFNNFNIYAATDNILSYGNLAKANNVTVQLGVQFVFANN